MSASGSAYGSCGVYLILIDFKPDMVAWELISEHGSGGADIWCQSGYSGVCIGMQCGK